LSQRLLFVVNVDWFFLSHRLNIAIAALNQGYQVHIATVLTNGLDELRHHGLIVHPLNVNRNSTSFVDAWIMMTQLWRIIKVVQPNLVHLVTIKPVLLGGLIARLAGVPAVVIAVSGLGFIFVDHGVRAVIRRFLVGVLYNLAIGHSNLKVIFQNPDDRTSLSRMMHLPDHKVEMIRGSGVDLIKYNYKPLPLGIPVVLMAARLLIDKGVREFIEAARLLKKQGDPARFCLVGSVDPDNPNSLTDDELRLLESEGIVELWGHRSDMPNVLASAHIVVLPSYYGEGLPKVLIEAAACGRAVVTTDHPGCRDAIDPGITGVLVPARNVFLLARAIKDLLDQPTLCMAMGKSGRALAEQAFDIEDVSASHLRIYQSLIHK
jgi:glycosyltransferase involved in cell wall biosynthesis